ncbi:hypothetical protein P7C73_g5450, partial [Tremellales sp. Uapishka_1]
MPPPPSQQPTPPLPTYIPDPTNTRALLHSLEELRDSLSDRVEQLSNAVERLRAQAGDLERALAHDRLLDDNGIMTAGDAPNPGRPRPERESPGRFPDLSPQREGERTVHPHSTHPRPGVAIAARSVERPITSEHLRALLDRASQTPPHTSPNAPAAHRPAGWPWSPIPAAGPDAQRGSSPPGGETTETTPLLNLDLSSLSAFEIHPENLSAFFGVLDLNTSGTNRMERSPRNHDIHWRRLFPANGPPRSDAAQSDTQGTRRRPTLRPGRTSNDWLAGPRPASPNADLISQMSSEMRERIHRQAREQARRERRESRRATRVDGPPEDNPATNSQRERAGPTNRVQHPARASGPLPRVPGRTPTNLGPQPEPIIVRSIPQSPASTVVPSHRTPSPGQSPAHSPIPAPPSTSEPSGPAETATSETITERPTSQSPRSLAPRLSADRMNFRVVPPPNRSGDMITMLFTNERRRRGTQGPSAAEDERGEDMDLDDIGFSFLDAISDPPSAGSPSTRRLPDVALDDTMTSRGMLVAARARESAAAARQSAPPSFRASDTAPTRRGVILPGSPAARPPSHVQPPQAPLAYANYPAGDDDVRRRMLARASRREEAERLRAIAQEMVRERIRTSNNYEEEERESRHRMQEARTRIRELSQRMHTPHAGEVPLDEGPSVSQGVVATNGVYQIEVEVPSSDGETSVVLEGVGEGQEQIPPSASAIDGRSPPSEAKQDDQQELDAHLWPMTPRERYRNRPRVYRSMIDL